MHHAALTRVILPTGSVEECAALVASAASTLVASCLWRRGRRIEMLFAAYLFGTIALGLGLHRTLGTAPLILSGYGLLLAVGVIAAWLVLTPRLLGAGLAGTRVFSILVGCLLWGFFGARLAHALSPTPSGTSFIDLGTMFRRDAGASVFGAIFAGAAWLGYLFRKDAPGSLVRVLDLGASSVWLNVAIARLGCMLVGCCYGAPTTSRWLSLEVEAGARVWATQPMEAAGCLLLTAFAEGMLRKHGARRWPGSIAATTAAGYAVLRGTLEFLRDDSPRVVLDRFTSWQVLAAALLAGSVLWLARGARVTRVEAS